MPQPPNRRQGKGPDPFGYDPRLHAQMRPVAEFFYRRYWRVAVDGIERVPPDGPVLVVGNHSGGIPIDAAMLVTALDTDHPRHRLLRCLYDRFVADMPLMGEFYKKMGSVLASYENARALLRRGDVVGIFPEGVAGVAKGVTRRYRTQPFHTGFIRLSIEFQAPIVPVAIVGAEETYPVIGQWKAAGVLTRLFNVPYVPVTPFFPLLGVVGAIPLPTRWHIRFGEPLHVFESRRCRVPSQGEVERLSEQVRRRVQGMIHALLAERNSVF